MTIIAGEHVHASLTDRRERTKANVLRALVHLSEQELCERLGLLPAGLEVIREKAWSLDFAFEVCVALGLDWERVQGTRPISDEDVVRWTLQLLLDRTAGRSTSSVSSEELQAMLGPGSVISRLSER